MAPRTLPILQAGLRSGAVHTPGPQRVVWEITWRCDLRCAHCLVDAGLGRPDELSTAEGLDLIDQLAGIGSRILTLTGGEPLIRADWPVLAAHAVARGLELRLSTNGHLLDDAVLDQLVGIGCEGVVVSVDGPSEIHDTLRRGPGSGRRRTSSHSQVLACLDRLAASPVRSSVITSVTRANLPHLLALQDALIAHGVQSWQVQLAHPTGRANHRGEAPWLSNEDLLRPEDLPTLGRLLSAAVRRPELPPRVHNTIGYLSRDEPTLRSAGRAGERLRFWKGCRCGLTSLAVEPNGGLKGCASQVGAPFVVGNVRQERVREIWDDRGRWHWLSPAPSQMEGACAPCSLSKVCSAGCTALAFGATGRLFDNPYCLRVEEDKQASQGRP